MAVLITIAIAIVMGLAAVVFGAYIRICLAIRREDHGAKWSLRNKAVSRATQRARAVTGLTGSRWG